MLSTRHLLRSPKRVAFYHGVQDRQQLARAGRQGGLCGFARGAQTFLKLFEHWVAPDCDRGMDSTYVQGGRHMGTATPDTAGATYSPPVPKVVVGLSAEFFQLRTHIFERGSKGVYPSLMLGVVCLQDRVEDSLSILCTLRLKANGSAAYLEFALLLRYEAIIACPMPVVRLDEEPSAPPRVLICSTDCTRIRTLKRLASRLPGEAIVFTDLLVVRLFERLWQFHCEFAETCIRLISVTQPS